MKNSLSTRLRSAVRRVRVWRRRRKLLDAYVRVFEAKTGLPIERQFEAIESCQGVFVGGSKRWLRAHGDQIVREARKRDLRTHVGNPGGADGLVWTYRIGFDSADTTTIFQNGYWHYLDRLEAATEETGEGRERHRSNEQAQLGAWS